MTSSKVTLSPEEWALVSNPDIILTKNAVIDKVYHLLGMAAEQPILSISFRRRPARGGPERSRARAVVLRRDTSRPNPLRAGLGLSGI